MQSKPTWNVNKQGQNEVSTGAAAGGKKLKVDSKRKFKSVRRSGTRGS